MTVTSFTETCEYLHHCLPVLVLCFIIINHLFYSLFILFSRDPLFDNVLTERFNLQVIFYYLLCGLGIAPFLIKVDFPFQNSLGLIGAFIRKTIKQLVLYGNEGFRIGFFC